MSFERDAMSPRMRRQPLPDESPIEAFLRVRARTERLAEPLSVEDQLAQSMPDASPVKWHLAHTTWFFEQVLLRGSHGWRPYEPAWDVLFNSYYEGLGERVARGSRGLITRPGLEAVRGYRRAVDEAVVERLERGELGGDGFAGYLFALALNHEQQHQELILTDVLHLLAQSPLEPAYAQDGPVARALSTGPAGFVDYDGGRAEIGWSGAGFAFDNEGPRHAVLLGPYGLADRPASNADWIGFIEDGGYRKPELWMADGWARAQAERWEAPLYWRCDDGVWTSMSLAGRRPVDPQAPVGCISWFEADAFARWAGARLPTEAEWERAAADFPVEGDLAEAAPTQGRGGAGRGLYGGVWEWTSSAYGPYPGFRPTPGVTSEYNGKFMASQMVLRGGSFATPVDHVRATYRNFFYPHQRWQFAGVRLARDVEAGAKRVHREATPDNLFLRDLEEGLGKPHKSASPKWFYDEEGSRLFEAITELPEYYLTRAESGLLQRVAADLAPIVPDGAVLLEFGSGASAKTRLLLDALPGLYGYAPLDISEQALAEAAARIAAAYPKLEVEPVAGDFTRPLRLPTVAAGRPRIGFFPGSTIGNFTPEEARLFLRSVKALLGGDALFVVGADLVKDEAVLVAAYDDAQGVTAAFNKNLLVRANRELGADFDLDGFAHKAVWNAQRSRIEMHLVSRRAQTVRLGDHAWARRISFAQGETIHTENSCKFTVDAFAALAEASGWRLARSWVSPAPEFAVFLLRS
jgi:dimethylhistidine N-methyltransferase